MPSSPLDPTKVEEANDRESAFRRGLQEIDELLDRGVGLSGHEPNCLFLNLGPDGATKRFATAGAAFGLDHDDDSRAPAATDWDRDGDLDLWVANRTAPMVRFLRNDAPPTSQWIAVRLEGRTVNRDAIGSRVEVTLDDGRTLHRTLRAGEGYLAQSSKSLHFGLGEKAGIAGLRVRWPGRTEWETFSGIEPGRIHRLVEGTGKAELLAIDTAAAGIGEGAPAPEPTPAESAASEALVASRWPLPRLPYRDWSGADRTAGGGGKPVLLNLWATWCAPCVAELKAFGAARERLSAAGLDVLALSVDGLETEGGAKGVERSTADPQKFLRELGIPFPGGRATPELVRRLEVASSRLFGLRWPLPVPTSVLLDGNGRIAALYRGPVEIDRLVRDAALLSADDSAFHDAALPLPGKWFRRPAPLDPLFLAIDLMDHGHVDDAFELAFRGKDRFQDKPEYAQLLTWLGDQLVGMGRDADALQAYSAALEADDTNVVVLNNVAWQLAAHPDATVRDGQQALHWARRAAELTKFRDPSVLDTLAAAQAEAGQFDDAVRTARSALQLAERNGDRALADGIRMGLRFYQARKAYGQN